MLPHRRRPHRSVASITRALVLLLIAAGLNACSLFNDPILELDPALRDSTLTALSASDHHPVIRKHILESFGSFGCVSCPEAEKKLAAYIHPELSAPLYNPRLSVVNYHVKFGTVPDPWVTPAIQAWHDHFGYVSLPQAIMDGSNAPFGIRETDASFKTGDYDSLVARLARIDSLTWLDLSIDTADIGYDTTLNHIRFTFHLSNRDNNPFGPVQLQVLAVKNQPVSIPIYPDPWEVIVVETANQDAAGGNLAVTGLAALTSKAFSVDLVVTPEAPKHKVPPPLGVERLQNYALLVVARDAKGVVINVASFQYRPVRPL